MPPGRGQLGGPLRTWALSSGATKLPTTWVTPTDGPGRRVTGYVRAIRTWIVGSRKPALGAVFDTKEPTEAADGLKPVPTEGVCGGRVAAVESSEK